MKAFQCEMCGSNDLLKDGEYFVCQHCRTKYTKEEAKKMMVEGTVQIDNSNFVQKYLNNARRAKEKEDWEEVEKYYNMVEQNDPDNVEAIFYSGYGKVKQSLIEGDLYKRQAIFKTFNKSISIIDDKYSSENFEEFLPIFYQMGSDVVRLENSEFVYQRTSDYTDNRFETVKLFASSILAFAQTALNISNIDAEHEKTFLQLYIKLMKHVIDKYTNIHVNHQACIDAYMGACERMHTIDPSFEVPAKPEVKACYIATCVYGDYNCSQVWILRRFRDYELDETYMGRLFIKTYYAISPTFIKLFGQCDWFVKPWKAILDRMVKRLKDKGFADTPYNDKY